MHIELIDLLRCPREHEETWLVAAFHSMDGRYVVSGKLGCPICKASYPIENGIADLRESRSGPPTMRSAAPQSDPDAAMRIAAMLGLTRPNSLIALSGDETALAAELSELTECRAIALNPSGSVFDTERVGRVRASSRIPLASGSLDGIVITGLVELSEAARTLKRGGRLVSTANASTPTGFRELARDDSYAVLESVGPLVSLSR